MLSEPMVPVDGRLAQMRPAGTVVGAAPGTQLAS
jgi:hypothetical protein